MSALSFGLLSAFWVLDAAAVIAALRSMPLQTLVGERGLQHLLFGSIVFCCGLWSLSAGFTVGLEIHFLAITAVSLVVGWDLAIVAGLSALILIAWLGSAPWTLLPLDVFAKVVIPVSFSKLILVLVEWKLPRNFFIFLFLCAFMAGGVAGAASMLTIGSYFALSDIYSWDTIVNQYFVYLPLIIFPEGFLNGVLMTGMLVYLPDWVRSFDCRRYLDEG